MNKFIEELTLHRLNYNLFFPVSGPLGNVDTHNPAKSVIQQLVKSDGARFETL